MTPPARNCSAHAGTATSTRACIYVGEGVGLLRKQRDAAAVMADFAGADALLSRAPRP